MRGGSSSGAARFREIGQGLGTGFSAELRDEPIDLGSRGVEGVGIVDDHVAAGNLDGLGKLRGEAGAGIALGAGTLFRGSIAWKHPREEALDLQLVGGRDQDDAVEAAAPLRDGAPGLGFEDERGLDEDNGVRVAGKKVVHSALLLGDDRGMDNAVQFGQAAVVEDEIREARPVQRAVVAKNRGTEVLDDGQVNGLPWLHEFTRNPIGFEDGEAMFAQQSGDSGLATSEAAGESDTQHEAPGNARTGRADVPL